jgi:hypothetical protein
VGWKPRPPVVPAATLGVAGSGRIGGAKAQLRHADEARELTDGARYVAARE